LKDQLNSIQRKAVTTIDGAVIVFAGAGSGKTRVITHRIAYLINEIKVSPGSVLAVTFTNKAAREMKERVSKMIGNDEKTDGLTVCTFHSLCLRILKSEHKLIDYPPGFTIYSPYEQNELMKKVMAEQKISPERFSSRALLTLISKIKNDTSLRNNPSFLISSLINSTAAKLFEHYQAAMKASGAMDFDDLLLLTVTLFKDHTETAEKYSKRFKYIMVDEYQDTNNIQFKLIKFLSSYHGNIFVVGDDDQSIYSWRGAEVENILNFSNDFKDATVIKLEENYRSVDEIVEAAGRLIVHNGSRAEKKCFTSIRAESGEGIKVVEKIDETTEAEYIAQEIKKNSGLGVKLSDIAVIIRANHQSKFFELAFNRHAIPFTIIGGQKFFENKEIKDILAYLRILINERDEISLRRIINYPARGIGAVTCEKFFEIAKDRKFNPGELLNKFNFFEPLFKTEQIKALKNFSAIYQTLARDIHSLDPVAFSKRLISLIKIEDEIKRSAENETVARIRLENIRAFIDAVATDPDLKSHRSAHGFFTNFINAVTLLQSGEEEKKKNSVTVITAHSAKGLEFKKVFLTGFYQGGMPNHISIEENNIDEERRLCYVAMTRAKRELIITIPRSISFRGTTKNTTPSTFLSEAGLDTEKYTGKPPETDQVRMFEEMLKKIRNG